MAMIIIKYVYYDAQVEHKVLKLFMDLIFNGGNLIERLIHGLETETFVVHSKVEVPFDASR